MFVTYYKMKKGNYKTLCPPKNTRHSILLFLFFLKYAEKDNIANCGYLWIVRLLVIFVYFCLPVVDCVQ